MLDFFNAEELTEYVDKKEDTDGRFLSNFLSHANNLYHRYLRLYSRHLAGYILFTTECFRWHLTSYSSAITFPRFPQ